MIRLLLSLLLLLPALLIAGGCSAETSPQQAREQAASAAATDPQYQGQKRQFMAVYQNGDYASALQLAIATLETSPLVEEPYVWVSSLHSKLGRESQGAVFFGAFAQRHPGLARPWFYKGRHELRADDFQAALASFRRAAEIEPEDPECYYWQGVILQAMGEFDDAVPVYERSFEMDPGSAQKAALLVEVLRVTGEYAKAENVVDRALQLSPESAELYYARGQLRLREMDYPAAEAALRGAIQFDATHRRAHQDLALLLNRTGRDGEAVVEQMIATRLSDYDKGKQNAESYLSNSRDPAVPMLLAEVELTERQFEAALRWFVRAESLGGRNVRTFAGRAEAHYRLGDTAAGDRSLSRVGDTVGGRVDLARAARLIAVGDHGRAEEMLRRAVQGGPDEREFLRRAADLYAQIGRASESSVLLVRATKAPRSSSAPEAMR